MTKRLTVEEANKLSQEEFDERFLDELEESGHATRAQVAEMRALGMSGGGLLFLTKEDAANRIAILKERKAVAKAKTEGMEQCWECGRFGVPDSSWSIDGGGWYCGC
jgi:diaminopimelate decarboxylase